MDASSYAPDIFEIGGFSLGEDHTAEKELELEREGANLISLFSDLKSNKRQRSI